MTKQMGSRSSSRSYQIKVASLIYVYTFGDALFVLGISYILDNDLDNANKVANRQ